MRLNLETAYFSQAILSFHFTDYYIEDPISPRKYAPHPPLTYNRADFSFLLSFRTSSDIPTFTTAVQGA